MKMNSTSPSSSSSSQQIPLLHIQSSSHHHFGHDPTSSSSSDDFLDHMLGSSLSIPPPPWSDLNEDGGAGGGFPVFDESALLASKLRQHQITPGGAAFAKLMLQQQLLMASAVGGVPQGDALLDGKSPPPGGEDPMQALFNGFASSGSQQNFQHPHGHNFGMMSHQQPPPQGSGSTSGGGGTAAQQPKQRVRARRGQATDPHSIAERLRRERIADRMKSLQELVPNGNKADKASMLDEIIDYVKFLQLQVKVLSMSRLGGAAAVAPLIADTSSERAGGALPPNATQAMLPGGDITEHQVAKLMDEDMGSAMQYLQGKGLCLMPISLATAISTVTCHARTSSSLNTSDLTAQSTMAGNGAGDDIVKDAVSVSKQ